MESDRRELDYSANSGSKTSEESMIDTDSRYTGDGRSKMETSFYSNEGHRGVLMSDGHRRPWYYFKDQHRGYYEDDYSERVRQAHVRRDAATFCETVDLSPHQKERVLFHVDDLDINSFGQTSSEAVILALIAYVCNVDQRWVQRENEFRDLLDSLQITSDKVKRVTRTVKERVE